MEILKNKPLVSAVIITYQYGHFIIVVDDGSTDDTKETDDFVKLLGSYYRFTSYTSG